MEEITKANVAGKKKKTTWLYSIEGKRSDMSTMPSNIGTRILTST